MFLKCKVFYSYLLIYFFYLCLFSISCSLSNQVHSQRWCFWFLGDVDDFLQTGHTKGYVLGGHTSVMESVQCHLCGGFSQRLGGKGSHHFTRMSLQMFFFLNFEGTCKNFWANKKKHTKSLKYAYIYVYHDNVIQLVFT